MTLHTLHDNLVAALKPQYGADEARAIARLVLETQCGASLTDILLDRPAEGWKPSTLERLVAGEPVQYVLGEATFCGHRIKVRRGVLIPRPETEFLGQLPATGPILDVCTGSGCIALAQQLLHPHLRVEAWDVSEEALAVAEENFRAHQAPVVLRKVDLLNYAQAPAGEYQLIVSNPPYIPQREIEGMEAHVSEHEPHLALFVPDEDPLRFYRPLARLALQRLRPGGQLAVECHTQFVPQVAALFEEMGLRRVTPHHDLFGRPRFVSAWKAEEL